MKLYVARHGQTQWNLEDRVCGRTDLPLTAVGEAQAEFLAEKARSLGITRILVSPMLRARQTAAPISRITGIPLEVDQRLIEQDYGIYENTDWDGPDFKASKKQFAVRYPGGESMLDLAARIYPLLNELKAQGGDTTLIVCHGGICRVIRTYFEDMTNEEYAAYSPSNAFVAEYDL